MISPGQVAAAAGVGLAAGLAGTASMTVSSTIEMKVRGRAGSSAPADAAGKLLGVRPAGEKEGKRFGARCGAGNGEGYVGRVQRAGQPRRPRLPVTGLGRGAVVDWIHVAGYPATFNLADIAIRVGAIGAAAEGGGRGDRAARGPPAAGAGP